MPSRSSWLAPALVVALLWAPLPGMAAVWFAVRAEHSRAEPAAFEAAAGRAKIAVVLSVLFGGAELLAFGGVGVLRWALNNANLAL